MAHLSLGWAYALLFASLLGFAAIVVCYELCRTRGSQGAVKAMMLHPGEDLVSSRARHGWFELGLSLFASFAGNWMLFIPADVGALYSWPGVVGYALAVSLPYVLLMWLSPVVKNLTGEIGFSGTDYLLIRYGRIVHLIFSVVSVICMFLSFVVDLTTIGITFQAITGQTFPPAHAIVPVALITLLYTLYGGLRTSILTDKYQGCLIVLLTVPVVTATFVTTGASATKWWALAESPTSTDGCFIAGAVLLLSLWPIFLLDQGIWQRMWAAKSQRDLNIALLLAGILAFCVVFLFGISGMACRSAANAHEVASGTFGAFAFLADSLSPPWLGVIAVLAVSCVASSVDTYQMALASVFVHDLRAAEMSYNWTRLVLLVGNAAAIAVACAQLSILTVAMASNMVCVVVSGCLLASVGRGVNAEGLLCGIAASFLTALACGICSTGSFVKGLQFFAPSDFSSLPYLFAFVLMPPVGFSVAFGGSKLRKLLRFVPLRQIVTSKSLKPASSGAVARSVAPAAAVGESPAAVQEDVPRGTDVS